MFTGGAAHIRVRASRLRNTLGHRRKSTGAYCDDVYCYGVIISTRVLNEIFRTSTSFYKPQDKLIELLPKQFERTPLTKLTCTRWIPITDRQES